MRFFLRQNDSELCFWLLAQQSASKGAIHFAALRLCVILHSQLCSITIAGLQILRSCEKRVVIWASFKWRPALVLDTPRPWAEALELTKSCGTIETVTSSIGVEERNTNVSRSSAKLKSCIGYMALRTFLSIRFFRKEALDEQTIVKLMVDPSSKWYNEVCHPSKIEICLVALHDVKTLNSISRILF